jgi:polysaccharide biosynthesis protein PslH
MRILLLCNKSPWPPKDGGASATLNIIRSLLVHKASVTVLALNTIKHFQKIEEIPPELAIPTNYQLVNIETRINYLSLLDNLLFSGEPYNLKRFWSSQFNQRLTDVLKMKFDIVQLEGLAMYLYLPAIRQNSSARVVFRPHNIENRIWSMLADEEKNPLRRTYFRILAKRLKTLEKRIAEKSDAVVPISTSDLTWFRLNGLAKPSLLSMPGYEPPPTDELPSCKTRQVFYIGALDWLPNIYGLKWFIKQVWPLVINEIPDAQFIIAGRNASKSTIDGFKGRNISYEGEVASSSDFIRDKSVMVVPLFSGSGLRLKIIEGMSLGKSIVTTPVGAEGIICSDNKDIFIASTPSGFAERIIKLLTNSDLRDETGKNAIDNVSENYNIFVSSANLMNFYEEITA